MFFPRLESNRGPFFYYFGGKWANALAYPRPKLDWIIEPFAGAAGYSCRYPYHKVSLYDLNAKICGIWSYLIRVSESEFRRLPLKFESVNDTKIPEEAKWLIGFWLCHATTEPRKRPSKWMKDGSRPKSHWGSVVRNRIANQLRLIRHWRVYNQSYESIGDKEATWFIDPPYNNTAGANYRHKNIDYQKLAGWCRARQGQVMVCEQKGADWLDFEYLGKFMATKGKNGKVFSEEVLWTNRSTSPPRRRHERPVADGGWTPESHVALLFAE